MPSWDLCVTTRCVSYLVYKSDKKNELFHRSQTHRATDHQIINKRWVAFFFFFSSASKFFFSVFVCFGGWEARRRIGATHCSGSWTQIISNWNQLHSSCICLSESKASPQYLYTLPSVLLPDLMYLQATTLVSQQAKTKRSRKIVTVWKSSMYTVKRLEKNTKCVIGFDSNQFTSLSVYWS